MLKLNQNSLFAILLRARWWVSLAVAAGVFFLARLFVPPLYAAVVPLPFLVIAGVALWRQLQQPSARKVAARLEALRGMSREEFATALERGFRREGYGVTRLRGDAADLEITLSGRVSLVDSRRWKATRTGVEPLREFHALGQKRDVQGLIYIATGEVTANARAFAREKMIRLVEAEELARLVS